MAEPIKPALTPEEWRDGEFESFYGKSATSAQRDHKGRWFFHAEMGGKEDIVVLNQSDDEGRASHKIAALALHGQPFGFTRDHLRALRMGLQSLGNIGWYEDGRWMSAHDLIADATSRIEALLPPEGTPE